MKSIEDKVEQALSAFDGMEPAKAPEGFEDRLFQRLRFTTRWVSWMRYAVAALVVIGLINVFTVFSLSTGTPDTEATGYLDADLLTGTDYTNLTISEE